jgi:L-cysteine/cystine lyase
MRLAEPDLAAIRAELPVLARKAYLNAGTCGPLPSCAAEAIAARIRRDLVDGRSGRPYWEEVLALREKLRAAVAKLVGTPSEWVALTDSTSMGCAVAVAALGLGPGDEAVTTDCEHPGLEGPLHASNARLRVARIRDLSAADALAAIEAEVTGRTRLVAVSHVVWTTGARLPVEQLAGRSFALLVDGAQSVGAIPVDVPALGADFYTVSGQKWLLGPDATGALVVRPERLPDLRLALPSYFSWEPGTYEPRAGAPRFDTGTISAASLDGLLTSLAFAEDVGPERFARAQETAERCRELLAGRARVVTEPGQATLVSFVPRADAAELVRRLDAQGVVIRDLPGLGWARASVGWWTSDEDLERLVAGLV